MFAHDLVGCYDYGIDFIQQVKDGQNGNWVVVRVLFRRIDSYAVKMHRARELRVE